MHYIIGTTISISNRPTSRARVGMTSADIANIRRPGGDHVELLKKFTSGKVYSLTRIYKRMYEDSIQNEVVVYRFVSPGENMVELEFKTVSLAEDFISSVRGEELPDYTYIHETKTD